MENKLSKILKIILIVASILALVLQVIIENIDYGIQAEALLLLVPAAALMIAACCVNKRLVSFILSIVCLALALVGLVLSLFGLFYVPCFVSALLLMACGIVCLIINRPEGSKEPVQKTKLAAVALNCAFGFAGAHRYYLGHKKIAIIQTCCLIIPRLIPVSMIWALVDFFLILADKLLPADGSGYKPIPVSVDNLASVKVLEKLAALHQQGVLTDEEFQQKKIELLSRI